MPNEDESLFVEDISEMADTTLEFHRSGDRIADLEARVSAHEAVCAERQGTIKSRLSRIEALVGVAIGALILVLWQLYTHQVSLP